MFSTDLSHFSLQAQDGTRTRKGQSRPGQQPGQGTQICKSDKQQDMATWQHNDEIVNIMNFIYLWIFFWTLTWIIDSILSLRGPGCFYSMTSTCNTKEKHWLESPNQIKMTLQKRMNSYTKLRVIWYCIVHCMFRLRLPERCHPVFVLAAFYSEGGYKISTLLHLAQYKIITSAWYISWIQV